MKMTLSKKIWIPVIAVVSVFVIALIISIILWNTAWKIDLKIEANQIAQDQKIEVKWDTSKPINKISILVKHNGSLVSEKTITDKTELYKGSSEVYAYYGKQKVEVTIYDSGIYKTTRNTTVNVSTDKYIIAPITATMPVTLFTLSLENITNNFTTPTFVWFKRSGAWDWSNLPQNVYPMPIANTADFLNSNENKIYSMTSSWVKELYEINKNAEFDFYYNDYFAYGWLDATIANGIPASNYHVTLLSDGTASFEYFNKHFNNPETYTDEYNKMKADYDKVKSQVAKNHRYTKLSSYKIGAEKIREYAYIMANEEDNVDWWLTRINGTMATNNPDLFAEISSNTSIKVKDLNGLLNALNEDGKALVKSLYNFSDTMFEKAYQENKNIMVILGTWTETEQSTNFNEYVKATMAHYGSNYIYYYKGHPKNPTNSVSGKLESLTKLGLIDVDSTIPAEIILFFNPEAFVSGYTSSTFVSVQEDKCCALFDSTKDAFSQSYKDNLQFFISKLPASSPLATGDKCFLLEFNDTTNYEIAVYNASKNTLTYYKKNDNNEYVAINK